MSLNKRLALVEGKTGLHLCKRDPVLPNSFIYSLMFVCKGGCTHMHKRACLRVRVWRLKVNLWSHSSEPCISFSETRAFTGK